MCDVMDWRIDDWPRNMRHVRDMWTAAQNNNAFTMSAQRVGSLVVTRRRYTLQEAPTIVPGHIGVATSMADESIQVIHASSLVVEERLMKTLKNVLGYIAL